MALSVCGARSSVCACSTQLRCVQIPRARCPAALGKGCQSQLGPAFMEKEPWVEEALIAKAECGLSFDEIAKELGLTNVYTAQMFYLQARCFELAQLKPSKVDKLRSLVPTLTDELVEEMARAPFRNWDEDLTKEPLIFRLTEAVHHNGEAIKGIVNEQLGDGIVSAIDFFCTVKAIKGKNGEDRVVISMNGKFLPFIEQNVADITE